MKNEPILLFDNVSKTYKKPGFIKSFEKKALDGISFSVSEGEVVGLLGLNGAGKTTIIKSIFSIIRPDAGKIEVFGKNPGEESVKKNLGYIPELPYFSSLSSAYEVLCHYAFLSGMDAKRIPESADEILDKVGLKERKKSKCSEFSKGMLQRLAFAQALIHKPSLVIMDEPVSGLDPIAVKELRDLIAELNLKGTTFFFSSHSISELEKLCSRVLIIKDGRIADCINREIWQDQGDSLENIFVEAVKK